MTIVNLAQDYVGSNNVNILLPNGHMGHATGVAQTTPQRVTSSAEPAPITRTIFHGGRPFTQLLEGR